MPTPQYIEYEQDGQWWLDIFIPGAGYRTYGPYTQRTDQCPRCQNPEFVITNGTGQCPRCHHQWEAEQHPAPGPGQVGHISINTKDAHNE